MRSLKVLVVVVSLAAYGCGDESSNAQASTAGVGGQAGMSASGTGGAGGGGSMSTDPLTGGTGGGGGAQGMAGTQAMTGGAGGMMGGAGGSNAGAGGDAGADSGAPMQDDPLTYAADLHELFLHDACTGENPSQPDTCLHELETEQVVMLGGETGKVYDVTLRIRGLFAPGPVDGGESPLPDHPYFKVGGQIASADYSHWHIEVSDPPETYWLNHYPDVSHTIYSEDFEAVIPIAGGAEVAVRVTDGNNRQTDNAREGLADRRQLIEGVTPEVLDGQMLRLDVIAVTPHP